MKKLLKLLTSIQTLHMIGAKKDIKQAFKYVY